MIGLVTFLIFVESTFAGPVAMNLQGRLFDANGEVIDSGTLPVTLEVRDPSGECLLFQEEHSVNMASSDGFFSVVLGKGNQNTSTAPSFGFSQALSNAEVLNHPEMDCAGNSYSPSADHSRVVRVIVDGQALSPDQRIQASAYSMNSNALNGKTATDFIQDDGGNVNQSTIADFFDTASTLSTSESLRWDGSSWEVFTPGSASAVTGVSSANSFISVANGTTTPELTLNVGSVANTVAAGDDSRFPDSTCPSGGFMRWDGSAWQCETDTNTTYSPAVASGADGLLTGSDKSKIDNIAAGAEVNVNADWLASSGDAQILNKPTIPSAYSLNAVDGDPVDALYVDSEGNVGIGTNTPTEILHIDNGNSNSSIMFSSEAANGATIKLTNNLELRRDHGSGGLIVHDNVGGTSLKAGHGIRLGQEGDAALEFASYNASGGTNHVHTSWGTKSTLEFANGAYGTYGKTTNYRFKGSMLINNDSTDPSDTANPLEVQVDDVSLFTILEDGNVGIGTVSPTRKLDVGGAIKADQFCIGSDCRLSWHSAESSGDIDIYVRTDGHDTLCNGSADSSNASQPNCAFLTVRRALEAIPLHVNGQVSVKIGAGTYYLPESETSSDSTMYLPVRQFSGQGEIVLEPTTSGVTLSGAKESAPTVAVANSVIHCNGAKRVSIESLTLTNADALIRLSDCGGIKISNLVGSNAEFGVVASNQSAISFDDNLNFSSISSIGIVLWSSTASMTDGTVVINGGSGITASNGSHIHIEDSTTVDLNVSDYGFAVNYSSKILNHASTTINALTDDDAGVAIQSAYSSTYSQLGNLSISFFSSSDWLLGLYAAVNSSININTSPGKNLSLSTSPGSADQKAIYAVRGGVVLVNGDGDVSVSTAFDRAAMGWSSGDITLSSTGIIPSAPVLDGYLGSVLITNGSWSMNGTCDASSVCN